MWWIGSPGPGAKAIASLTVVQALQRPLKVGETRGVVLRKCGRILKQRKLFGKLGSNLQLLWSQQYSKQVPVAEQEAFQEIDEEATMAD